MAEKSVEGSPGTRGHEVQRFSFARDGRRLKTKSRRAIAVVTGHQRRLISDHRILSVVAPLVKIQGPTRYVEGASSRTGRPSADSYFRRSVTRRDGRRARSPFQRGGRRKKRPTRVYAQGALQRGQGKMPREREGGTERARKRGGERHV